VDPSHNSFSPLHCGCNQRFRSRTRAAVVQLLRILQMPGHEYSSDNGQYAFSPFIHSLITETGTPTSSGFALCSPTTVPRANWFRNQEEKVRREQPPMGLGRLRLVVAVL